MASLSVFDKEIDQWMRPDMLLVCVAFTLAWRPRWLRVFALPRLQRPIR